jgi:erythromycin esterase-like protein
MSQNIRDFVTPSCDLLALGEPTHQVPAFAFVRNELFAQLVDHGFRSIALETDRVAALAVNDYVQEGVGTLDTALRDGFSHDFGDLAGNRQLVAWMREYNESRPAEERLAFHGFDASMETMSAPSPRRYLEHARDYLGLDVELPVGADERWSRTEAVLDPTESPGETPEAERLRTIADDLLTMLYARAPELIEATSRDAWHRARIHLTAGLGLLRYHKQSAQPGERSERISRLSGTRDALMAQNLLDIGGPTLIFAHNTHLQRYRSEWLSADLALRWSSAGSIVSSLVGERYVYVAGSLGSSAAIGLAEPEPDTYEGLLQREITTWGLVEEVAPGRTRTDPVPRQGYFPLTEGPLATTDAVLHINAG